MASPPQRGRGCGQRGRTAGLCSACESHREQRVSGPRPGGRPTSSLWLASTRPAGRPAGTASQQPAAHQRPGSWPVSARRPVAPKARPAQPGVATVRVVGGGRGDLEVSERRGPRRDAWAGGAGPSARPRGPFSLWPVPQRPRGAGSCGGSAARPSAAPLLGGLLRCWAESEAGGERTLCPLVSGHDLGLLPLGPAPWLPAGPSDPAPPQPPRPHPDQRPQPPPGARHRPLGHPPPSRRLHTAVKRRSRPELWAAEGTRGCYGNKN